MRHASSPTGATVLDAATSEPPTSSPVRSGPSRVNSATPTPSTTTRIAAAARKANEERGPVCGTAGSTPERGS